MAAVGDRQHLVDAVRNAAAVIGVSLFDTEAETLANAVLFALDEGEPVNPDDFPDPMPGYRRVIRDGGAYYEPIGASQADRIAEDHGDQRRGPFRRMTLFHGGVPFLKRYALELDLFGVYLHHLCGADPGMDLHDHPFPFVTVVLWGGYSDIQCDARLASKAAKIQERFRYWGRWSIHRMPLTIAHRIDAVKPHTWTLVLRGRKSRDWGFYPPDGYMSQRAYDYETRRPVSEVHG